MPWTLDGTLRRVRAAGPGPDSVESASGADGKATEDEAWVAADDDDDGEERARFEEPAVVDDVGRGRFAEGTETDEGAGEGRDGPCAFTP